MRFFKKGKKYRVVTHAECGHQLSVKNSFHFFNRGSIVECLDVYPVGSRLNLQPYLKGLFVDDKGIEQELTVNDVEALPC